MTKNKDLVPINVFKNKKQEIMNRWLKEIRSNPNFCDEDICKKENLEYISHDFLSDLIFALEQKKIPSFSHQELEPVLKLWHQILRDQVQKGFSTKETAMLIFSLKKTIMTYLRDFSQKGGTEFNMELSKLGHILDLFGILTFEIYSTEKDVEIHRQKHHIQYLQDKQLNFDLKNIVGSSPEMGAVFRAVGLVLENDVTVLLVGESGTGKDVIANLIHKNSKRKQNPFVTINCGAIPKDLIESELFGHEKGSFTGALEQRIGKFELAQSGTLFLDEISELDPALQVKLLRVLQNREIERIGGDKKIKIDVRIIAATNINLKKAVDEKKFRLDLYYRLNVFPIKIPPLRERKSDILPLAQFFLDLYSDRFNSKASGFSTDAKNFLLSQKWEGNVRELENIIQRAVILCTGDILDAQVLQRIPGELQQSPPLLLPEKNTKPIISLEELEKTAIIQALKTTKGNIRQAAKGLGISRTTFYNKATKYNLEIQEERT